jgi:hypothetical protein
MHKYQVKFNGEIIDTRRTERTYTHALVLANFNPEACRAGYERDWRIYGKDNVKSSWVHAIGAQHLGYKYASVICDADRARYAKIAATHLEDFEAQCRREHFARCEVEIAEAITKGDKVLSYHRTLDLAAKAQGAAAKTFPSYTVLFAAVEPA